MVPVCTKRMQFVCDNVFFTTKEGAVAVPVYTEQMQFTKTNVSVQNNITNVAQRRVHKWFIFAHTNAIGPPIEGLGGGPAAGRGGGAKQRSPNLIPQRHL